MARKAKNINIQKVAEAAGVSVATVSRVLNNHSDISESLRRKVSSVIESCGFVADKAVKRTLRLSVVIGVGDITDYISSILTGMGVAALEEGIELSIQRCLGKASLLKSCRIWRSDGVAIICGDNLEKELPALEEAGIPCVVFGCCSPSRTIGNICGSPAIGTPLLEQYLYSLGHRRIAYLCGEPPCADYDARLGTYVDFMKAAGAYDPELIVPAWPGISIDGIGRDKECGYQQASSLFSRGMDVTCLLCANDEIAFGCYRACAEHGRRVPDDISITGYDDQSFARYLVPGLTTVRVPLASTGRKVVQQLADFLRGRIPTLSTVQYSRELLVRGSTAPPPKARP